MSSTDDDGPASTPYVAFADDDSWWAPGALQRAADLFGVRPRMGLLAARILVGSEIVLDPSATRWADPCWAVQPICPDRHCWDSWPVLPWSVAKPSVRSAVSRRSSAFPGRRTGRTRPCRGGMGSGLCRRCMNFVPVRPDAAALAALPRLPAALRARRCTSDAVERNLNRLRSSESRDSSFVYGSPPRV